MKEINSFIEEIKFQKKIEELLNFSIINVDKPPFCTSFDVCEKIKKILGLKKTGHFGTLDFRVTGVIPVSLNRACRLSKYFIGSDKEYIGKMKFHKEIDKERLEEVIKKFIGKIKQLPPKRSSVKRVEREKEIKSFKIEKIDGKIGFFSCKVEAGTYVRKLIHDIGKEIGGAHMIELRRTKAGIFEEKESLKLDQIKEAYEEYKKGNEEELRKILIPGEIIIKIIPYIQIEKEIKGILNGKPLTKNELDENKLKEIKDYFVLFYNKRFIGIYKKTYEDKIIARAEFVLN